MANGKSLKLNRCLVRALFRVKIGMLILCIFVWKYSTELGFIGKIWGNAKGNKSKYLILWDSETGAHCL